MAEQKKAKKDSTFYLIVAAIVGAEAFLFMLVAMPLIVMMAKGS